MTFKTPLFGVIILNLHHHGSINSVIVRCASYQRLYNPCYITSLTAPQDGHKGLVPQVYLGSNTLELSATVRR